MIKMAFCDDKLKEVQGLSKIVDSIIINNNLDIEIASVTDSQDKVYNLIKNNRIDVLFLDIDFQGSETNGILFAEKLRKINKSFYLIFCTGHFEYAMLSFKCKTYDYILKPINIEILKDLLSRINSEFINENTKDNQFIRFKNNVVINSDDIVYIEKDGYKANIFTEKNCYTTYGTMDTLLENLPENFIRCHRSYIANTKHILSVDRQESKILFKQSLICPVTGKYITNFMF